MIYIDLTLEDQIGELKEYLRKLGADLPEEKSPKGIEDDVRRVIEVCDVCFKEANESDVEIVLNDIMSILLVMPACENTDKLIASFVEKISQLSAEKYSAASLRVLWVLFQSLNKKNPVRYHIYYHLVIIAQRVDMVLLIFKNVKQLKELFAEAPLTNDQTQKLLRSLHDALLVNKHTDVAAKVMIELLGTYTAENASQAKKDAHRCIVTALADPNTFLLDPLLSLKPIKALKNEQIYELLNIFVSEKLSAYMKFYKTHKDLISNLGLDHSQNMKKMRLLTFMQLAEKSSEIPFETIQKELNIAENDVEAFIIEALKTKLVRARMDQTEKKVHISSTMHRTFGLNQWQQLRDILQSWKLNLNSMDDSMKILTRAQGQKGGQPYHAAVHKV